MGMAASSTSPTATWSQWGTTTTGTTSYLVYANSDRTYTREELGLVDELNRAPTKLELRKKEKRALVKQGRAPLKSLCEHARRGFQQMCRLPCYRGVRTR